MTPRMEKQMVAALRRLMDYVGGWDEKASHPCGQARDALAAYDASKAKAPTSRKRRTT